jgi:hypothetical protein
MDTIAMTRGKVNSIPMMILNYLDFIFYERDRERERIVKCHLRGLFGVLVVGAAQPG